MATNDLCPRDSALRLELGQGDHFPNTQSGGGVWLDTSLQHLNPTLVWQFEPSSCEGSLEFILLVLPLSLALVAQALLQRPDCGFSTIVFYPFLAHLFITPMLMDTPQSLSNDRGGDVIVCPMDPHLFVDGLKIHDEFEHGFFGASSGWVDGKDLKIVVLHGLSHHPLVRLVFQEAMLPTKFVPIQFGESLNLVFHGNRFPHGLS